MSGAARWLTPEKALIQLCLRYNTDDQYWFSFFHEAGHILLHGKKDVFVDDGSRASSHKEKAADTFAADFLIPGTELGAFFENKPINEQTVTLFANQIAISPSIVIGRLQHDELISFNRLNHLKHHFEWQRFEEILSQLKASA